ncbi:polysaccharide pyruvyl transferase family protein [Paratractidigestivibacter sp.]|uniref:polysaccharide pyruvyl transferase family protein n=1 Tax=Paratractidigestivibacter sp. TaxID=2847316 RepID=UPI002ACB1089|nr:polysaccharide pyruvyl transferase family protein [Paratractidigestivibacter sp.]
MTTVNIVTIQGNWNYGNRLQNYAVSEIYRSLGYDAVSLVLRNEASLVRSLKSAVKKTLFPLLGKDINDPELLMTRERSAAFKRFSGLMNFRVVRSVDEAFASDDLYSIGSDQVWSIAYPEWMDKWYFLVDVKPEKKIALAPSIGVDSLDEGKMVRLGRALDGYVHLSVRESRGAEIIKEATGKEAEVVCDPTLVLPDDRWRGVADPRCTPADPYVFTYLLGGRGAEAAAVLDEVTKGGRVPVIPLTDKQKSDESDAGPAEFIDLIDHAEHVVTDSFHAAVFSVILGTPLTIVRRDGGATMFSNMFSRLEQLSTMLGIEEKVYGSPTFDLARAGEFGGVDEAIAREREKFMNYLESCLNG